MSDSDVNLLELVEDYGDCSDEEAYAEGKRIFKEEFIDRGHFGIFSAHDGANVIVFADRFEHAFKTSADRGRRAYSKGKIDLGRLNRIRWIRAIVEGRVSNTECWEIPLKVPEQGNRPFPGKRLYVSWEHQYLIWLDYKKDGSGFRFSTAYYPPPAEIARYTRLGRKIWSR